MPVFLSLVIAPVMQALTHAGSSQWRQLTATEATLSPKTEILLTGSGFSDLYALTTFLDFE